MTEYNTENKEQILSLLADEFSRWEDLLAGLSEEQITALAPDSDLSIKDTMAHLMAWQQRSIARMEAALHDREPEFPKWPEGLSPEADDVDQINAWIFETYHDQSWSSVHRAWKDGYLRFLELGQAIDEKSLMETGKYPWLAEYPLAMILLASFEHHHIDHLEPLLAWLGGGK